MILEREWDCLTVQAGALPSFQVISYLQYRHIC